MSEGQKQVIAALMKAKKHFTAVAKSHTVKTPKFEYSYASLEDIMAMVDEPLAKNDLLISWQSTGSDVTTVLYHSSGEFLSTTLPLANGPPQSMGSAMSYMKRYGVSGLLGIVTEEDDDGQRAQDEAKAGNRAQASANAPRARQPSGGSDDKDTAVKALWAQTRATGKAMGLDAKGSEGLMREKLEDYNTDSTKTLTLEQLKELRGKLKAMEEENSPS